MIRSHFDSVAFVNGPTIKHIDDSLYIYIYVAIQYDSGADELFCSLTISNTALYFAFTFRKKDNAEILFKTTALKLVSSFL